MNEQTPEKTLPALAELESRALIQIQEELKGNGLKKEQIEITTFEAQLLDFPALITLTLKTSHKSRKQPGKIGGQHVLANAQALPAALENGEKSALSDPETLQRVHMTVLQDPNAGAGVKEATIALPFLNREYVYYEPCGTCRGLGQNVCNRCQGKGQEQCPRCHASGRETCTYCNGRQYIQNGQNEKQQCLTCNGSGKTPCTLCQQTRTVQCPTCKGKGKAICQHCKGQKLNSVITTAETTALAVFSFEREPLPPAALAAIDNAGADLKNHVVLTPLPPQMENEKQESHIRFQIQLPFADITFKIDKQEVAGTLFGTQGALYNLPPFLENAVLPGMIALEEAAASKSSAAEALKRAGQYRTLRYALQACARWGPKKTARALLKKWPLGLSGEGAEKIAALSAAGLKNLSHRSVLTCRLVCMATMAGLYALYAYTARASVMAMTSKAELQIFADLAVPTLLALTGFYLAKSCTRQSMAKNLRLLFPEKS
ncbi:MAG: hypothetical protein IT559_00065 [Alphaproteobacteria bacterium]|nr:hypothetical protein [Alphaproteobacteria bacterium]